MMRKKRRDRRRAPNSPQELTPRRDRSLVGMALAGTDGAVLGLSWSRPHAAPWWVAEDSPRESLADFEGPPDARISGEPLLGALLVNKYHLITAKQLEQALEEQLCYPSGKRRLGDILVDTGRVTPEQLQKALVHQGLVALRRRGA